MEAGLAGRPRRLAGGRVTKPMERRGARPAGNKKTILKKDLHPCNLHLIDKSDDAKVKWLLNFLATLLH